MFMMIRARKNESLSTTKKGYKYEKVSISYAYWCSGIQSFHRCPCC